MQAKGKGGKEEKGKKRRTGEKMKKGKRMFMKLQRRGYRQFEVVY